MDTARLSAAARFVPFAYGFRPFFLAAGWYALIAVSAWLWIYTSGAAALGDLPPHLWHGHEMLFGFIGAAIAGFMLTAVPSWTGSRGFAGAPLITLATIWLAGRLAFMAVGSIPVPLLALLELAFMPALAATIAPPLLREGNRNTPLLLVLGVLWAADAVFVYAALVRGDIVPATTALYTALNTILLLITIIGGRIVPAFTTNALKQQGIVGVVRTHRWVERLVIPTMAVVVIVDVFASQTLLSAAVAAVAAFAHAVRLIGWRGTYTLSQPIVWVLHAAYAWLPLGLVLKAVYLSTGASWAAQWAHALTIGAAATMVMAVMTRAALGHTGRPLVVARPIAIAYGLLIAGAAVRVFGPAMLPAHYTWTVIASAILWIGAFALYVVVYTPILVRPRVDGRPG